MYPNALEYACPYLLSPQNKLDIKGSVAFIMTKPIFFVRLQMRRQGGYPSGTKSKGRTPPMCFFVYFLGVLFFV
jgi:hypothetical protein